MARISPGGVQVLAQNEPCRKHAFAITSAPIMGSCHIELISLRSYGCRLTPGGQSPFTTVSLAPAAMAASSSSVMSAALRNYSVSPVCSTLESLGAVGRRRSPYPPCGHCCFVPHDAKRFQRCLGLMRRWLSATGEAMDPILRSARHPPPLASLASNNYRSEANSSQCGATNASSRKIPQEAALRNWKRRFSRPRHARTGMTPTWAKVLTQDEALRITSNIARAQI